MLIRQNKHLKHILLGSGKLCDILYSLIQFIIKIVWASVFWQKVKCVTASSILVLKRCQQNIFSRCNQTCLFGPSKDHIIIITFIFSQWNAKTTILAEIVSRITIAPSVNIIPIWFLLFLFQVNVAKPQVRLKPFCPCLLPCCLSFYCHHLFSQVLWC